MILRDLALTPLRFKDLQAINPTVSPTSLTRRLRQLEAAGIIECRTIRVPARTSLCALAEGARPLVGRVLTALVELGAHLLENGPPLADPAETLAEQMRLNAHFVLARGCDLEGDFVFDVGGIRTHVVVEDSDFHVAIEAPEDREPDAIARFTPPTTTVRIMGRVIGTAEAEEGGGLEIVGDRERMLELLRLLSFSETG